MSDTQHYRYDDEAENSGEPHMSRVDHAVDTSLRRQARYRQADMRAQQAGFDIDRPGETGQEMEHRLLQPYNRPHFHTRADYPNYQESYKDDTQAITSAVVSSPLVPVWDQRELNMTEWTRKLHERVTQMMMQRGIYSTNAQNSQRMGHLIKIVPCLHNRSMDFDRGIDCTIIFHDPAAYASQDFDTPVKEAMYWNPEKDTVVNIDMTAHLATKFSRISQSKKVPHADLWVSKTGSAINHYLRSRVEDFPEQVGGNQAIRDADARMTILAARIVDIFQVKSGLHGGEKLPHIYGKQHDVQRRLDEEKTANREKHKRAMLRKQREKAKKEKSRAQSQAAKAKRESTKR